MMTMVISGSDGVTFPDSTNQFSGGAFSFKNRAINGDMRIAQRGTAAVTANGAFPVDRFFVQIDTDGAFSAQQDSSAPAGFVNSLKFTTTTADASLGALQYAQIQQRFEGTNVADLSWGSASAKTVTLSFWVRSSLTGTFGGAILNGAANRSYPFTYTISVADTWEQKSVTIPGDTSGTWLTTTGIGLRVNFGLGVGSTYSGTAGSWAGSEFYSATGAVSVIGTLNATWYITGVQLEVGSVATPFERRPYGTELALCQRYFQTYGSEVNNSQTEVNLGSGSFYTNTEAVALVHFPVVMRAQPTYSSPTVTNGYRYTRASASTTLNTLPYSGSHSTSLGTFGDINLSVAGVAGNGTIIAAILAGARINFSAEL